MKEESLLRMLSRYYKQWKSTQAAYRHAACREALARHGTIT